MEELPELSGIRNAMLGVARKAGEMITSARPSTTNAGIKINSSDLVTETDQAVERMIQENLQAAFPSFAFHGEESYDANSPLTAAPTFVCDPIDGTTNFVHSNPYVSISLAFVHNRIPLVGVVYNPFSQHLYHGIRGQGSFVKRPAISAAVKSSNDSSDEVLRLPLREPSEAPLELRQALVAVEWGNERTGRNWAVKLETFRRLAGEAKEGGAMVHSLRSLGSAALNLCGVAAGQMDAYWEGGCWAWDVAAGWVILEEAGGMMVGGNQGEWEPKIDGRRYLAVRGGIGQKGFVEEFWKCVGGRLEYGL